MREGSCHNCGLPSWAISSPGETVQLRVKAESHFRRDRHISAWCCSPGCAVQARAIAEMGSATHKWPISLDQFAALEKARSDRYENRLQVVEKSAPEISDFQCLALPYGEHKSVTKIGRGRPRGRPKKHASAAERQRAYRRRMAQTKRQEIGQGIYRDGFIPASGIHATFHNPSLGADSGKMPAAVFAQEFAQ